jgi:hypothetical protein
MSCPVSYDECSTESNQAGCGLPHLRISRHTRKTLLTTNKSLLRKVFDVKGRREMVSGHLFFWIPKLILGEKVKPQNVRTDALMRSTLVVKGFGR